MEKLKENREKRRAQQAQILEEQETLRNKDPTDPNWEFRGMIGDYKDQLEINTLQDGDPIANHQITVCIRKRPMSTKETKKKEVDVVTIPHRDVVTIHEPKLKVDLTKYLENQHFRYPSLSLINFLIPITLINFLDLTMHLMRLRTMSWSTSTQPSH